MKYVINNTKYVINNIMTRITFFIVALTIGVASANAQPYGYTPLQVLSLFSEDYRNEQYENALVYGRWLVEAHPTEMEEHPGTYRGDRVFRRMINIYEHMSEQQDDPGYREAYIDSALQMYDRVLALFTEEEIDLYRWHFRRGRFYMDHSDHIENATRQAIQDFEAMFRLDPERATRGGRGYYVQLVVQYYASQGDQEEAFSIMNAAEPYADEATLNVFSETRNDLITDPEERIAFLLERLGEMPGCQDTMEECYELYLAIGDRDKAREMAIKMYEADPSVSNILRLVDKAENVGNYAEANDYLEEAHEKQEGRERAETSLRIAENHLSLRNLQEARRYARRAANEDAGWGEPYITIARIYGRAVSQTAGREMTRADRAVYWLVLDYLDQARQRDSGVTSTVDRLYRTYEPVAPSAEDKFYQNWDTGESIRIDGSLREAYSWIDEETTIR